MSGKFKWYAARLLAMEPAEIAHRFIEVGQKWRLRRMQDGWSAFAGVEHGALAGMMGLRLRLSQSASFTVDEVLTGARFLGRTANLDRVSARIPDHAYWFHDPVSGQLWPAECPAFDVDVRSTSARPYPARPFGDVKYVWEPNRLQSLQPLAAIIAAGGHESTLARALAFGILRSWMDANPPYRGVNWLSGIELSLRLVSLTMLVAALEPAALSTEEREILGTFIAAHARMLEVLPSLYSSANNHRVAEGLGLFLAGSLLPASVELRAYRAHGQKILESETLKQIYADGVGCEQSPTYQAFTLELIAFAALLARDDEKPFGSQILARLAEGAKFLIDLQNGAGHVPAIGDDDEGRVILAPQCDEPLYVASVAACVADLSGANTGSAGARPGYFRELLFGLAPASAIDAPQDCLNIYPVGGYSISHGKISDRLVHLVFDHGPLGYMSLAAHGHADALSVWLSIDNRAVFIDAGTWLYHSGETTRSALRSSQAHNTLSISGLSQSEPSAAFSWSSKARAQACEPDPDLVSTDTIWSMAGEHDGYFKRAKVIHRRDIICDAKRIAIADRLTGQGGAQAVDIGFLCDPLVRVVVSDGCAILSWKNDATAQPFLRLRPPQGFTMQFFDTGAEAGPAHFSPRFGEWRETARILLRGVLGPIPCRTLIEFDTQ